MLLALVIGAWALCWKAHPWTIRLLFMVACLLCGVTLSLNVTSLSSDPMVPQMVRLMLLAEGLPLLLVLGLGPLLRQWTPDAWVAVALRATVILVWMVPARWSAELVRDSSSLLPWLCLLSGLLMWQTMSAYSSRRLHLLLSLPMLVAGGLLLSPVLLTVASRPCLWNFSPLQSQHAAGLIMLLSGLPGLIWSFWPGPHSPRSVLDQKPQTVLPAAFSTADAFSSDEVLHQPSDR